MKPRPDTRIIQSLDKGLALLEAVEQAGVPVGLKDLASRLGWDKATIHRLLSTLERRGYLTRQQSTKRYTLGLKIFGLYDSLARDFNIQEATRPYLALVAERTRETAHLAVGVARDIVFIDRVASRETLVVNTQIGAREPMFCTALGRAILAYLPDTELTEHVPKPLVRYTQRTTTSLTKLRRILFRTRERGYAMDIEEYVDGIRCVAAPILNHDGAPVAALGISGPRSRLPLDRAHRFGLIVSGAARELSTRAAWRG